MAGFVSVRTVYCNKGKELKQMDIHELRKKTKEVENIKQWFDENFDDFNENQDLILEHFIELKIKLNLELKDIENDLLNYKKSQHITQCTDF